MVHFTRSIQAILTLLVLVILSSCTFGQAAEPTATTVDVNAVQTSAAATAFVELTRIAAQAGLTPRPTEIPTQATSTNTSEAAAATATQGILVEVTPAGLASATDTTSVSVVPGATIQPTFTTIPINGIPGATVGPTCYNSGYSDVIDVTIPDGTVLGRGAKFYKIWRVANTGLCGWDEGFRFIEWSGPLMGTSAVYFSKNDIVTQPGGVVDIGIELRAPFEPGDYVAHWTMVNDSGKTFGKDFTVSITVK